MSGGILCASAWAWLTASRLLPRWGLAAAAGPGCARGVCSAAFLTHPGQLGAGGVEVTLGAFGPGAQFAA